MTNIHPQFITDDKGKKISVILSLKEFNAIIEELEELEDIKLYDKGKKDTKPGTPIDEAFNKIEKKRKKK